MLDGTPYSLTQTAGQRLARMCSDLEARVALLRRQGSLDPSTLAMLRKEWGIQQVYESAGIEGNQLDLNETEMAILRGITITGKPAEHSEDVRNLHSALEYVETIATSTSPLSERELREIHQLVVGRGAADAGAYRRIEVKITNSPHVPPTAIKVQEYMGDYFRWLASVDNTHVPIVASVSHAWLVHVPPFRDGNGRTARAIMNLLLMRQGFPIVVIRRKDRERYYEALRESDEGDLGPFLELLMERTTDAIDHIDAIRKRATGISLAMEKVRVAEEREFRLWFDGIQLLRTAIGNVFKQLNEQDEKYLVHVTNYGMPSLTDYEALKAGSPSGNSWLLKVSVQRAQKRGTILYYVGFCSKRLQDEIGVGHLRNPLISHRQ